MRLVASDWAVVDAGPIVSKDNGSALRWQDPDGPLAIYRLQHGSSAKYRFRLGDDIAVDLTSPRQLSASIRPGLDPATLEHFLADQVIPRALAGEGRQVIHAGAVRHGDGSLLLLGASGRGKSTLTTSFFLAGHVMLGDDATVIDWVGGQPSASAVYPSLRLFPDSIEALVPERFFTRPVAAYTPKRRVEVPLGHDQAAPALPVAALFVIGPETTDGTISIRRLSVAATCIALVENSFALDPADTTQAGGRLEQASALANAVPAFAIRYPHIYARLPDVRAAILDQVGNG